MKAEGSDSAASQSSPSEETATTMTEVKVKTELPDDFVQEVLWQEDPKEAKKSLKDGVGEVPAEICVVIGGVRNQQTLGKLGGWSLGFTFSWGGGSGEGGLEGGRDPESLQGPKHPGGAGGPLWWVARQRRTASEAGGSASSESAFLKLWAESGFLVGPTEPPLTNTRNGQTREPTASAPGLFQKAGELLLPCTEFSSCSVPACARRGR